MSTTTTRSTGSSSADLLRLAVAGFPLIAVFYLIHRLEPGQTKYFLVLYALAFLIYFGVILRFRRLSGWKVFAVILAVALFTRIPLLGDPPLLDDDIYRYLWDGRISSEGINPYRYPPDHPKFFFLRDEQFYKIRFRQVGTVYPPLSQLFFLFPHLSDSWKNKVMAFKVIILIFEIGIIITLWFMLPVFGVPPGSTLIYAWSPLAIKEFAGSGHLDAIPAFFLLWAVILLLKKKTNGAALLLALSFLGKFYVAILIPFLGYRLKTKGVLIFFLIIVLAYLPFLGAGSGLYLGTLTYFRYWEFNSGLYAFLRWLSSGLPRPDLWAKAVGYLLLFLLGWLLFYRRKPSLKQLPSRTATLIGFWIVVSPVVNPWYLLSFLPLLAFYPLKSWLYLTAAANISYSYYLGYQGRPYLTYLEYFPFFLILLFDLREMIIKLQKG